MREIDTTRLQLNLLSSGTARIHTMRKCHGMHFSILISSSHLISLISYYFILIFELLLYLFGSLQQIGNLLSLAKDTAFVSSVTAGDWVDNLHTKANSIFASSNPENKKASAVYGSLSILVFWLRGKRREQDKKETRSWTWKKLFDPANSASSAHQARADEHLIAAEPQQGASLPVDRYKPAHHSSRWPVCEQRHLCRICCAWRVSRIYTLYIYIYMPVQITLWIRADTWILSHLRLHWHLWRPW